MPSDTQPHPDQRGVEPHPERPRNVAGQVDYVPHPEKSIPISPSRKAIQQSITNLYCGSALEKTWLYRRAMVRHSDTVRQIRDLSNGGHIVHAGRACVEAAAAVHISGIHASETADSLISLKLEDREPNEKVVYHKDMWNEKDYSHEGLGMLMKKLNGDKRTFITKPPESV
ncbi:hypothetical protein DL765_009076 [Monosporascus sp. GIB2]|nr:hypothetical protein DL765_009076 [Monosporascus sp. GIB2]